MVRDGLWGLVNRSVFYELVAQERREGDDLALGACSAGGWFELGRCPAPETSAT